MSKQKNEATEDVNIDQEAFYKKIKKNLSLEALPLTDIVLYPGMTIPITLNDEEEICLVKQANKEQQLLTFVTRRPLNLDPVQENSQETIFSDTKGFPLYNIGVIGSVLKVETQIDEETKLPSAEVLIRTYSPVEIQALDSVGMFSTADIKVLQDILPTEDDEEMKALMTEVQDIYYQILTVIGDEEMKAVKNAYEALVGDVIRLNFISVNSPLDILNKQHLLEERSLKERAKKLIERLQLSKEFIKLKAELTNRTTAVLNQQQKEMFLRQQINTIQDELGGSVEDEEMDELDDRAEKKKWNEKVRAHYEKEMRKLERFNSSTPEYGIQYGYLETMLNLPWDEYSEDNFEIPNVEKTLDKDHYGLEKVKERIVEQVAVMKLRKDMKAPILCLYGPPGVGKTSLGKSIAEALGREYARISLGGVHDEAEIRGHRRTYIGAMPGRIIAALEKVGTSNPVFVLDEIDKIGQDIKGDPSAALLEALDPEQNSKFHDNYLDVDYDLSHVMFIATANSLDTVSGPLRDRMEIIEISGYVAEEKLAIAQAHLIPKILKEHGLKAKSLKFTDEAVRLIIDRYTRESGVRQLEKKLAKVVRKLAVKKARGEKMKKTISDKIVRELLGREEVNPDEYENNSLAGVVTGLAWTSAGGEILFIETSLSKGKGEKLTLTGQLGDVMKESAVIALQYIKAHAPILGIDEEIFKHYDVHIHVPEGAIPKDGPSAGVTMLTSLVSAFTRRRVRPRLAMTSEITLRGKVLPVGGIKEKILAARRAGITDIMLCTQNRRDIDEIKADYLDGLTFHYVDNVSQVLDFALTDEIDTSLPPRS